MFFARVLGVELFERAKLGVEPTCYGREVASWGVTRLEFLKDPTCGELKVGTSTAQMGGFTPTALKG